MKSPTHYNNEWYILNLLSLSYLFSLNVPLSRKMSWMNGPNWQKLSVKHLESPTYILFHIGGNLWVYPQGLLGEVKSNLMARIIFQLFHTPEHWIAPYVPVANPVRSGFLGVISSANLCALSTLTNAFN